MDWAGAGDAEVGLSVGGMEELLAHLRTAEQSGDWSSLPSVAAPSSVGGATADLDEALRAGQVAMDHELDRLVAFIDGAVEAFRHLDRVAVTGRLP